MPPLADSPPIAALTTARGLLGRARDDALALQLAVDALTDATDWRAKATDGYRAGMSSLAQVVERLRRLIDASDDELAGAATVARDGAIPSLSGWW